MLHESKAGQKLLFEYQENLDLITPSRQTLVSLVCDMLMDLSNNEPKPDNIRMLCLELIDIFPSLKVEPSEIGGIVNINSFLILLVINI